MAIAKKSPSCRGGSIFDAADGSFLLPNNVGVGDLVVIAAAGNTAVNWVAADCTQIAGTATLGAIALDFAINDGVDSRVGYWSAIVTGAGSLTMQVASAGNYGVMGVEVYTGSWDAARKETSHSAPSTTSTTPTSGNATSAGAALFVGALAVKNSAAVTLTEDAAFASIKDSLDGTAHVVGELIDRIVGTGTTDSADWVINIAPSNSMAAVVVYREVSASGVSVTSVSGDNVITSDELDIQITGSGFSTATVEIRQGAVTVGQSIDSQSSTLIQIDFVLGGLKHGAATLAVVNADTSEGTISITINAPTGQAYVDIGTPDAEAYTRLSSSPDLESGDQVQYWGAYGVDSLGGMTVASTGIFSGLRIRSFYFRVWDVNDHTWGASQLQTIIPINTTRAPKRRRMVLEEEVSGVGGGVVTTTTVDRLMKTRQIGLLTGSCYGLN